MSRTIHINPSDAVPLWSQIEGEIRRLLASGVLSPGSVVPSVREMSRELRVNPATVSKAYRNLCQEGLLVVRRGEGTFVAESIPTTDPEKVDSLIQTAALRYASQAKTVGVDRSRAIDAVGTAFNQLEEPHASTQ